MNIRCPICDNDATIYNERDYNNILGISCNSCGKYEITMNLKDSFKAGNFDNNKYIIAGWLYETKNKRTHPLLSSQKMANKRSLTIDEIVHKKANVPHSVEDKLNRMLLKIKEDSKEIGEVVSYLLFWDYPSIYAMSQNEFKQIISLLEERKLIRITKDSNQAIELKLCNEGYKKIEMLKDNKEQHVNLDLTKEDKKTNIFISYDSKDNDLLKVLVSEIKKRPILNPIVVATKPSPRKPLAKKVEDGITESKYFIPILTNISYKTQWVNQEIGYAEALETLGNIKIVPIIESSVRDKLKGFIHKNEDLPYRFARSDNKRKEKIIFRKKCQTLLDYILDEITKLENVKKQERIPGVKENLYEVGVRGFKEKDIIVNRKITKELMFNLRVKLSTIYQHFIAYYSFKTNTQETIWIGYKNNQNQRGDHVGKDEYTKVIKNNQKISYSIDDNVVKTIKKRFPNLTGTPVIIEKVRFRGDSKNNDVINFYYAFSEKV
ncbi:MAG: toll/interleukin-1 receptor domain-containing protein [Candidatus Aureabacteria bacterium]|nr:toll/interleukin-1 receptor domain-containing protein [Candidatus Auribacterota bacterium]